MKHLYIKQNNNVEIVSLDIIEKLYQISQGGLYSTSDLIGNLQCTHAYDDAVTYLTTKFKNLQINVTDGSYIRFADKEVEKICATSWGDGTGLTTMKAATVPSLNYKFRYNSTIVSFNEFINFINVKALLDNEFSECSKLQTIDLANITTLGGGAFQRCTALTSVLNLNDAITEFPGSVFNACSNLVNIHMPTSCTVIETAAFYNCAKLVITDSLSNIISIGTEAFKGCLALTTLSFSSSLTTIGDAAFQKDTNLTSMGDTSGITTLGSAPFEKSGIVSINLSSCAIISNYAFNGCSKLESVVLTPLCKTIGFAAFQDCIKLTNIGNLIGVTTINQYAFNNCALLTTIDLSSCTSIGELAFGGCTNLTSIVLTSQCLALQNHCFNECTKLATVGDLSGLTTTVGDSHFRNSGITSITLGALAVVANCMFYNCTKLVSVTGSQSFTSIGEQAFQGCTNLISVDLGQTCTSIGNYAFYQCTNLVSIGDISKVTFIDAEAFGYCSNLTGIIDISGYTSFGSNGRLFENCPKITGIVTPTSDNVFEMRESFFESCIALTSFTFPKNVSSGNKFLYMFIGCTSMTTLTFWQTSTCKIIGENFCRNCSSLTTLINFPQDITTIESGAFADTSITNVSLGEGLTTLGYEAFARTKLDSITLPSTFTTMGGSEFSDTNTPRWAKCLATTPPTGCDPWSFSYGGTYPIYVPDDSLATYKAATNWSTYSTRIKALSTFATDFPNG